MEKLYITTDASLQLEAAQSDNALKRFDIVAYTGGAMNLNQQHPVVVDLAGMTVPTETRPVFLQHDHARIVGHTEKIKKSNKQLTVSGVVSGVSEAVSEVLALAANGFPWQASIGASIEKMELVERGVKAKVNGQTLHGPVYVARKTTLNEVSFVPLGADDNTRAMVASKNLGGLMSDENENLTSEPTVSSLDEVVAKGRAELARRQKITEIVARLINEQPDRVDQLEATGRLAIEGNWSSDKLELELLRSSRPLNTFSSQRQVDDKVIEAAVCLAGGLKNIDKHYSEPTLDAAEKTYKHGLGLNELLLHFAHRNGYRGVAVKRDLRNVLQAASLEASIGPSTYSLSGILSNVANKFVRDSFNFVDQSWRKISAIRSVNDFKQITTYSLTGDFLYEEVGKGGVLKHDTVGEESYTNIAKSYGKMFGIDRRDLVNDDLGALTGMSRKMGRGAALSFNTIFWTVFQANTSFFTAARGNYDDGADSAFDEDGLASAYLLFLALTDPDGNPMGTQPQSLLVPTALVMAAKRLINSAELNSADDKGVSNPWSSMFQIVSSPYLTSATKWYLLADANDVPVIEVCFLNGQELPTVESADMDFDRLGIAIRGYHDWGCALQEYRGGVAMNGA